MEKSIILPVDLNPWVRCYRIHSFLYSIIGLSCDSFNEYVLSNYLCLHNGKEGYRREYLDFHLENNFLSVDMGFRNNSWFDIDVLQFSKKEKDDYFHVRELIIDYLKEGYYLIQNIDEGKLPYNHYAKESILKNIVMTHGFDESQDSFYVLGYDFNGRYGSFCVLDDDFLNATCSSFDTFYLCFIKKKENLDFKFDDKRAKTLLYCHLNCRNAYPDNERFINNVFGYQGIERTFKEYASGGNLNLIRLRVIKEHKELILRYLKYIYENGFINDITFIQDYSVICEKMNSMFLKTYKKTYRGDFDFSAEIQSIRELNLQEAKLIEKYLVLNNI